MWGHTVRERAAGLLHSAHPISQGSLFLLASAALLVVTSPAFTPVAPAARIPDASQPPDPLRQPLEVTVTGNPPGEEIIRRATAWEVRLRQQAVPGSQWQLARIWLPKTGFSGGMMTGAVVARVKQPGAGWHERKLPLRVSRLTPDPAPEGQLFVSNRPHEKVFEPQILFEGRITAENPARILYHHLNASGQRMGFSVELLNPSAQTIRVQMLDALRGPMVDVIRLGHSAAVSFVEQENRGVSYVVTIPPYSAHAPIRLSFPPKHIVSGLGRFRVLTPGGAIILRVRAIGGNGGFITAPLANHAPSEVYGAYRYSVAPFVYRDIYIAGRGILSLPLGEVPAVSDDPDRCLKGGYGVWHKYTVTLVNPVDKPAAVTLHVSARGGAARLIYTLGQEWRETRILRAFQELPLMRFHLEPREVRAVTLTTVPQAGSAYPLRFEWRSGK